MGSLCLSFEKDTHLRYNKIIKMKWLLALISIAVTLFVITQGKSLESASVPPDAECLLCVDDIMAAIDHCTNATTPNPTMECINMLWELLLTAFDVFAISLISLMVEMAPFATKSQCINY